MNDDLEHLRLLSIFHYVVAGLAALFGCIPIIHVSIGVALLTGAFDRPDENVPPDFFGWLFIVLGGFAILTMWLLAGCLFVAGRRLAQRRNYTFCLVTAGLACLFMPFGTVLGVFTIIVLCRPSVKRLFDRPAAWVDENPVS